MGSAPWMASPEDRQACAGVSASGHKSSPSSRLPPLLAAFGLDSWSPGPRAKRSACLHLHAHGGRAAPAVLSAPSRLLWIPWFRMGRSPADPAASAGKGTCALWLCRCSWGRFPCLSCCCVLSSCVSQLPSLMSHQTRCCSGGFGKRFPFRP